MDLTVNDIKFVSPLTLKVLDSNLKVHRKRAPTKLSLKKNVRRSSIYDKLPHSVLNRSIVIVDDSSESVSSGGSKNKETRSVTEKICDSGSIIEISDDEEKYNKHEPLVYIKKEEQVEVSDKENIIPDSPPEKEWPFRTPIKNAFLSETKLGSIQNWVNKLNSPNDGSKLSNDKLTTNVDNKNAIGKKTNINNNGKNKIAINSTFVGEKSVQRMDEWLRQQLKEEKKLQKVAIKGHIPLIQDDNEDCRHHNVDKAKSKEIWKPSDKAKEEIPELKAIKVKIDAKLNKVKNADMKITGKSEDNFTTPTKPPSSIQITKDDVCKILDDIYGNSWHKKRAEILSEGRVQRKVQLDKLKQPNTERKKDRPDDFEVYKNPYLDSERAKSKNLLHALWKKRVEARGDSPFFSPRHISEKKTSSSSTDDEQTPKTDKRREHVNKKLEFSDKDNGDSYSGQKLVKKSQRQKKVISSSDESSDFENDLCGKVRKIKRPQRRCTSKNTEDVADKLNKLVIDDESDSDDDAFIVKPKKFVIKPEKRREPKQLSFLTSLSKNVPDERCDPSALIFKNNFKKNRDKLIARLFKMFNTNIFDNKLPDDVPFEWSARLRGTAGNCTCRRSTHRDGSITRSVRIQLSEKVLDSADRLRDTLVHELCHAATFIVNKISNGHGEFWKAWAAKAMRVYPELPPIKRCHDYTINFKYTYKCISCGYSFGRHSKSLNLEKKCCGYCHGKFEVLLNKTGRDGDKKAVPCTPKKEASGFSLFVKENYKLYKTPSLKHGDVMKLLGRMYQEQKTGDNLQLVL